MSQLKSKEWENWLTWDIIKNSKLIENQKHLHFYISELSYIPYAFSINSVNLSTNLARGPPSAIS